MRSGWMIYLALTMRSPRTAALPDERLVPIEPGAFESWTRRSSSLPEIAATAGAVCTTDDGRRGRLVAVDTDGRVKLVCQLV